jgi:hypothetical protein
VHGTHEKVAASKYVPAAQVSGVMQSVLLAVGIRGREQGVHHAVPPGHTALGPAKVQGKQVAPLSHHPGGHENTHGAQAVEFQFAFCPLGQLDGWAAPPRQTWPVGQGLHTPLATNWPTGQLVTGTMHSVRKGLVMFGDWQKTGDAVPPRHAKPVLHCKHMPFCRNWPGLQDVSGFMQKVPRETALGTLPCRTQLMATAAPPAQASG